MRRRGFTLVELLLALSLLSLRLGPRFYGFGFAVAVALTAGVSRAILAKRLDRLV